MTQLFTGTGLGLEGSSLSQLGNYGPKGGAGLGQGGESVYVNATNGNLVIKQSDGFLSSTGLGLDIVQIYNSRGEGSNAWRFNTQVKLEFEGVAHTPGSLIKRIGEDGHCSRFIYDERQQRYVAEDGSTASIVFHEGHWQYSEGASKTKFNYTREGQLINVSDNDGHVLQFHYEQGQLTSITDRSGKQTVTWSFTQGILHDVTWLSDDSVVHYLEYSYDQYHRLSKISRRLDENTSYWITYDYVNDSNLISDIAQSDGTKLHIDYDAEGRVRCLSDGEGRKTTYQYSNGKTIVRNGADESWVYSYDIDARLTGIDGPENYHLRYYYEGHYLVSITQGNQHWQFTYNDAGDCTRIESPSGQVTLRSYDTQHYLLAETHYQLFDGDHHPHHPQTQRFVYDERGHLRFEILADGSVTEYRYDNEGRRINSRCYLATHFNTQQLSIDHVVSLEELVYWSLQQNQQQVNLVAYAYDWRGNLTEEIHYTQLDEQGQGILSSDALRTYNRYDASGLLVEKTLLTEAGLSTTHYIYDGLGRLVNTLDNQGHQQSIEYDDAHHRIIKTSPAGLQTISTYDQSGLLLSTHRLDSHNDYGTIHYGYDAAGRLITETSLDGKITYSFYDHQGRLQGRVTTSGQVIEYTYDEEGHCIQTHQYYHVINTNSWLISLPQWFEIKPQATSQDRISQVIYNSQQQIAFQIDAEGAVIGYQYDAEGRVVVKTAYAKRLAQYDPAQQLVAAEIQLINTENDRTIRYYYDVAGRLQGEINAEGAVIGYRYDNAGNLIECCRYVTKAILPYTGDWAVDIPSVLCNQDIHTYSLYNLAGLKVADIDAEGYLTEYAYDASGLLISAIAYYTAVDFIFNDSVTLAMIRPPAHPNDHATYYHYNDLNQLIETSFYNGLSITYGYNEQGLLISKTQSDSKTKESRQLRYRYDALGRVTQSLDALGVAYLEQHCNLNDDEIESIWQQHNIRYDYDISGNLIRKINALNQTTHYFYNEAGLLTYSMSAEGSITETRYNAFNQVDTIIQYSAFFVGKKDVTTQALAHYVSSIADVRFDEITHYEYNNLGLVISQNKGSNGQFSTTYNVFGELETSSVYTGLNHNTLTSYQYDRRGLLRYRTNDVAGINQSIEMDYDVFGRLTNSIDSRHALTTYGFNKRGEQILSEHPDHRRELMSYDGFGRVIMKDDKTQVTYIYDDQNQTLTLLQAGSAASIVTQFNAFGDKLTVTDRNHQATSYQYDANGQLIHTDAPENTLIDYHYDSVGNLIWQQDAAGHIQRYSYNAEGCVLSKTIDPDGLNLISTYTYDAVGRQLQIIEGKRCTQFTYDNQGNLIKQCVDPGGLNLITEFSYTVDNHLAREISYNPQGINKVMTYEWDALGRCVSSTLDPDGLGLTTSYQYDKSGNLISQTDANQHRIQYVYDVNNRLRYQVNASGVVTEHRYTYQGNESQIISYAHPVSIASDYDENTLAAAIQIDDIADHHQFFAYNNQNQLSIYYDALGYATRYSYDGNGNIITKYCYATSCSLDLLKNGNRPLPMSSLSDRYDYFFYDGLNQQRFQIDTCGRLTEFNYDKAGQLIKKMRFSSRLSIDELGLHPSTELIQKRMKRHPEQDESTYYSYDMASRLNAEVTAGGAVTTYQYDDLGNLIATTQHATRLSIEQLATERWLDQVILSDNDRTTRVVFDAAAREIYRINATGHVIERCYDAVGNILMDIAHTQVVSPQMSYTEETLTKELGSPKATDHVARYQYDAASRLLIKTDAEQHTTTYTYDNNNNVATKTDANHACWRYYYDAANQLIETHSPLTTFLTYQQGTWVEETRRVITQNCYDSFSNVISITRDAKGLNQTVLYTYDANNRKVDTVYPNRHINNTNQGISSERLETATTLTETCCYNAFGEMIASRDKSGQWRRFAYDNLGHMLCALDAENTLTTYRYTMFDTVSMKTTYANRLQLRGDNYDVDTLFRAIEDSDNDRQESYRYDKEHHLIEHSKSLVTVYNSRTMSYHRLIPMTRSTYNAFGELVQNAVKLTDSDWAITRHYYGNDGLKTASKNAEDYLTTYTYNEFGLLASETQYADRTSGNEASYELPATSRNDRQVILFYDALGQLTHKTLKQISYQRLTNQGSHYETISTDLTSSYGYDAMGNLVSTTDALGNTTYSYYNESGQLIAKTGVSGKTTRPATTYRYDALGQLVESRQWAYGANATDADHFYLNGPSSDDIITNDAYDIDGHLVSQTDGTGHTVYYSYDANGNIARCWQVLTQADSTLVVQDKRYSYDHENRLTQSATLKTNGQMTTDDAQYNAFGEVIAKGFNRVFSTKIDYDRIGRVWRSNMQGYAQIYVYDLTNLVTQVVTSTNSFDPNYNEMGLDLSGSTYEKAIRFNEGKWYYDLQRQDTVYDALGRLISQTKDGTMSALEKDQKVPLKKFSQYQEVDRWGNVVFHTNARGYSTQYDYNAFDQIEKQILPEVNVVDERGIARKLSPIIYYATDALGRTIGMTDANGHTVAKKLDEEGRVREEIDALGHHRDKSYNLLGQLFNSTNERGGLTTYVYDKANRLLSISTPQTWQGYQYDGAGQLTEQTDGRGNKTRYWYDTLGQQIKREQAGAVTQYEYDATGHKISEYDALGNTQYWHYDDKGYLRSHRDLGGHQTEYTYNYNGLLLTEQSTQGKNMRYHYFSDGQLQQVVDNTRLEVVNYTYDAQGNVASKDSSRPGDWIVETDRYEYDALGRLLQVRRRHPDDKNPGIPEPDRALLSIDYDYDAVGNIRDTKVVANYTGYQQVSRDDYFRYDANNRMILNKGQLQNNTIVMTASQGSELTYDETGNINTAAVYENGLLQHYGYRYNTANQLETIRKNGYDFQTKAYDKAGNIEKETLYNTLGSISQHNVMGYTKGRLTSQTTSDIFGREVNRTQYTYDAVGNLTNLATIVPAHFGQLGYVQSHQYTYELWDSYQQKMDNAQLDITGYGTTFGKSQRIYDSNGQLQEAIDSQIGENGANHSTQYLTSSVDGIKARKDTTGQTSYLNVGGKTIGDLRLDNQGIQHLDVYSGFTPSGSPEKVLPLTGFLYSFNPLSGRHTLLDFLHKDSNSPFSIKVDGTLPEAPQDNLGTYTLQAGDTLESIALQVYGDSSLWYLLADANGITDRSGHAGEKGSQLHIGQQLNISLAAKGQHHTNNTHKAINSSDWLGNINATTPLPAAPPVPKNHHNHWKIMAKIVGAVVAAIATVASAGVLVTLAGPGGLGILGSLGISDIVSAGLSVIGGSAGLSTATSLGIGFSAGFIGSIASQSVASALNTQKGIDWQGALITGLATAATAGIGRGLTGNAAYGNLSQNLDNVSLELFSVKNAAEMMEKDALSQTLNLAIRRHQHFDWLELGTSAVTAGLMGSKGSNQLSESLKKTFKRGGSFITNELQNALSTAANTLATGGHFNASQILIDNLGSSVGSTLIQASVEQSNVVEAGVDEAKNDLEQPTEIWNNDAYESLTYDSELFKAWEGRENNLLWGSSTHDVNQFINDSVANIDNMGLTVPDHVSDLYQDFKKDVNAIHEIVTADQLRTMFPSAKQAILDAYLPEFNKQLEAGEINTPKRLAYFFATVNEETGGMTKFVENNFTYKDPARARTKFSANLANKSNAEIKALGNGKLFANTIYANINGNGNLSTGDGYLYRGRGLFHYSGRGNYLKIGGNNIVSNPDLILKPANDVKGAVTFWKWRNLSDKVDVLPYNVKLTAKGQVLDDNFKAAVKPVNAGYSNLSNRAISYNRYLQLFQSTLDDL